MILTNIPSSVTIVAATKTRSTEVISAYCASVVASHIGENYVQEWESKHDKVKGAPIKHLIGHLQSNKAKKAVELFDVIQSIDSVKIAEAVAKEASKINKVQAVMIQVNISEDEKKSFTKANKIRATLSTKFMCWIWKPARVSGFRRDTARQLAAGCILRASGRCTGRLKMTPTH